jgi:hypothetical protein
MTAQFLDPSGEIELPDTETDRQENLDLFSISPTRVVSARTYAAPKCAFGAPYFAYQMRDKHTYGVVQGSCNKWECPRCGQMVAKGHYGRIVSGARALGANNELWFITLTCRGKDVSVDEAITHYLAWTSKFFDACYAKHKRAAVRYHDDTPYAYVQVTEQQRRGHPHSHVLTTFTPYDLANRTVEKWHRNNAGDLIAEQVTVLGSIWIESQLRRSGLGEHYDISRVRTVEAVSRYVAKYMFKASQFEARYPKHWRRVRYTPTYPKLPDVKTNAFVLLTRFDWQLLAGSAAVVVTDENAEPECVKWLTGNDVVLVVREHEKLPNHL